MSLEIARQVLELEAEAVREVSRLLDDRFLQAMDLLMACPDRIVTTGMGKSGIIAHKLAATLASTGSPALFLHPAEAIHGDLGMVTPQDVVLALSNSGETQEILRLVEYLKRQAIPIIAITSHPGSSLGRVADVCLLTGDLPEACHLGLAPTTSTTAQLALGDALSVALSMRKGFRLQDFAALHPGGKLGKRLQTVGDLMRTGDSVPRVRTDATMKEALFSMSEGRMGITAVTDEKDHLLGVISDGDLRRLLARDPAILERTAGECLIPNPKTVRADELATAALERMERNKITSLFIPDENGRLVGAIHLHDLWGTEMI